MNSVSWFIYIAQVSNSVGNMMVTLGVVGLIAIAIYVWAASIASSIDAGKLLPQFPRARWFALAIGFLLVGNLMPERNTMYAIAASQVGEQVVKSEIASDATKALHSWIKKQIEPEAKK
jgi:predicted permease